MIEAARQVQSLVEDVVKNTANFPQTYFGHSRTGKIILRPGLIVDIIEEGDKKWAIVLEPEGIKRYPLVFAVLPRTKTNIMAPDTFSSDSSLNDYLVYGWKALQGLEKYQRKISRGKPWG
ncbi:MAG: hypothetical protein A3H50_01360 [Candidatus Levybacteria bacterium RIFCSPLOWO2_02_FULL_37_10]|nr:MAG: hypothetical protein A2860_03075 [Candidatus Levybacteria bacterium RIFCSPHIGHO2_01_FULL_37_33]OGH43320.1 MAG: hypothetical protein A3H50_01360 [Candidatus Levybacteria bacterium RIFCSPLOWO2_02_FULL_37_10]